MIAVAPVAHQLEIDMLPLVAAGAARIVCRRVRIGEVGAQSARTQGAAVQPDELAVRVERAVRAVDEAARVARRIAQRQAQQAAGGVHHRRVEIGRSLGKRDLVDVLAVGELGRIRIIVGGVVERHALQQGADLVLSQPAHAEADLGGQAERIGGGGVGTGQQRDQLERVGGRRLALDEVARHRADRLRIRTRRDQSAAGRVAMHAIVAVEARAAGDDDLLGLRRIRVRGCGLARRRLGAQHACHRRSACTDRKRTELVHLHASLRWNDPDQVRRV